MFGCSYICHGTRTSCFFHAAPKMVARMSGFVRKRLVFVLASGCVVGYMSGLTCTRSNVLPLVCLNGVLVSVRVFNLTRYDVKITIRSFFPLLRCVFRFHVLFYDICPT